MRSAALTLAVLLGCVTPGTRPGDMSASAHEGEASKHEALGAAAGARFNPDAAHTEKHCGPRAYFLALICWKTTENPTEEFRREMERHLKIAAEHRAASRALRDAEAAACAGVSEEDRAMSPLEREGDVVKVEPIYIGAREHRLLGATVTLRPVAGLTVPALERILACHIARNAALGHEVPEMPACPLVPRDVEASVSRGKDGFDVVVRSWDDAVAHEIWRRAELLEYGRARANTR